MQIQLKCPKCSNNTLAIARVFIADLFGWGVRCFKCDARLSHASTERHIVSILICVGMPCLYAADKALYAFHTPGYETMHKYIVISRLLIACFIGFIFYYSSLILREEAYNKPALYKVRKTIFISACIWGGLLLLRVCIVGFISLSTTLEFAGVLAMPILLLPALAIFLVQDWTI